MSYLAPPPMPAAVIVTKDVGGFVTEYQNQTAIYRATDREVRLHECRSACTLALSLPNVCVYPDSILKFHLAYDPRNHQPNASVSQEMFDSYPAAVRARLGTLTREYKVLRGSELIALGIRDCNAPKTIEPKPSEPAVMVASASARKVPVSAQPQASPDKPLLAGLMNKMLSVFGGGDAASTMPGRAAVASTRLAPKPPAGQILLAEMPLPPPRPAEFAQTAANAATEAPHQAQDQGTAGPAMAAAAPEAGGQASRGPARVEAADAGPTPPERPSNGTHAARRPTRIPLPKLITGAQPILPQGFSAYADFDR